MRTCTKCGETKPQSEYYNGCASCKPCVKQRASEYYLNHREQVLARQQALRSEPNIFTSIQQAKRFWSHVDKSSGESGCWNWLLGIDVDGYGSVRISGRGYHASKIAWVITNGNPGDLKVLHSCDNRACCNPAHLFLGTSKDNSQDMVRKGRSCPGEKNGHHKLTVEQVAQIRNLYAKGHSKRELGRQFNTNRRNITFIVRMDTWK